jgi:hypothetical protein
VGRVKVLWTDENREVMVETLPRKTRVVSVPDPVVVNDENRMESEVVASVDIATVVCAGASTMDLELVPLVLNPQIEVTVPDVQAEDVVS